MPNEVVILMKLKTVSILILTVSVYIERMFVVFVL
jgi:hypothetical protein